MISAGVRKKMPVSGTHSFTGLVGNLYLAHQPVHFAHYTGSK